MDEAKIIAKIKRISRLKPDNVEIKRLMDVYCAIKIKALHQQISNLSAEAISDGDTIHDLIISIQNLKITNDVQAQKIKE